MGNFVYVNATQAHHHNLNPQSGVLTQLAIVIGIMVTQLLGLRLATPTLWRFVFLFSSLASVVQLCLSRFIVETPVWLKQQGKTEESRIAQNYLFQQTGNPQVCVSMLSLFGFMSLFQVPPTALKTR